MSQPKHIARVWIYDDGGRAAAGFRGTCGDCVVRAIAIATEASYGEVYAAISRFMQNKLPPRSKARRQSPREGVPRKIYEHYLRSLGWVWVAVMGIGTGCRMHLRPAELPAGRIIARTSRHLVACVDGIVHDTHDSTRAGTRCVYGYWRLDENTEAFRRLNAPPRYDAVVARGGTG